MKKSWLCHQRLNYDEETCQRKMQFYAEVVGFKKYDKQNNLLRSQRACYCIPRLQINRKKSI